MGIFDNVKQSAEAKEGGDSLGGNFGVLESDVYDMTIAMAYAGKSTSSDAQNVTFVFKSSDGKELRQQIYVTNGQGENFYVDRGDNKTKHILPGWQTVEEICLLTTDQDLTEQASETKTVKIYNFDEKKEVPTEVPVLINLIGKNIKLAVQKQTVDKQKKGDDGKYHNTGETRDENEIAKAFHIESGRTVTEYKQNVNPGEFMGAWVERNKGKTRNRAKGGGQGGTGTAGSGRPGGAAASPKQSLFGANA